MDSKYYTVGNVVKGQVNGWFGICDSMKEAKALVKQIYGKKSPRVQAWSIEVSFHGKVMFRGKIRDFIAN